MKALSLRWPSTATVATLLEEALALAT